MRMITDIDLTFGYDDDAVDACVDGRTPKVTMKEFLARQNTAEARTADARQGNDPAWWRC